MKITATYEELVAVELPAIKKEEFNNTLSSLICVSNSDDRINEVFLTGFPFERIKEMLDVIDGATKTGCIRFKEDGVLYTKTAEKLYVEL